MSERKRKLSDVNQSEPKKVSFASDEKLETVHLIESFRKSENGGVEEITELSSSVRLTEEITILSTVHGASRRYLRDITKADLKTTVKYGVRERGHPDPKTGLPRWKYTFGNVVYITDHTSRQEVTCYKQPVDIAYAPISSKIMIRHEEVKQILQDEPQLCTSHTIVILDQSGSMRKADVNGFRSRSHAAYGSLALDYVAECLYQQGDLPGVDSFSMIQMNDSGTFLYVREPLDWILFNNLLDRTKAAMPRSHGNYNAALTLARDHITKETSQLMDSGCEHDALPSFALVFLSDGKPSDRDSLDELLRGIIIRQLAELLQDKLSVFCMGIGASHSDFDQLSKLASEAQRYGARGNFLHAGLSAADLGRGFSSISSTMTSLREDLLKTAEETDQEDDREIVALKDRKSLAKSRSDCRKFYSVLRYNFNVANWDRYKDPWVRLQLKNNSAVGFMMDKIPFGKGAERLAFRFQEMDAAGDLVGKVMVAKESKRVRDEKKKMEFHSSFCRTQLTAGKLARLFNDAIKKHPAIKPVNDFDRVPKIEFLKCCVYVFKNEAGLEAGVLVEDELKGKFTKFNGNNGFVNKLRAGGRSIELQNGEVFATDFLSAFSHWSFVHTDHRLLVCDLQGVLNEEGKYPCFQLTDPAICSKTNNKESRFGQTDVGIRGIRQFCQSHECSKVCKSLGLPPIGTRKG